MLITSLGGRKSKKSKKAWKYGARAGLQGGRWLFPIYFFQGLSFLHLEIILLFAKLCNAFEEKLFFSATIIFGRKSHSKLSKNDPENVP